MKNKYGYSFIEKFLFSSANFNQKKLIQKLKNKTVLISGASFGIGESIAYNLAVTEITFILVARSEEKLMEIKKDLEQKSCNVFIFVANLYKQDEVEFLNDFLKKENLKPDIFISNAGKSIKRSIFKSLDRFHDFSRTMNLNYFTPVNIILSLIPVLVENKGQIINISTMNVLLPAVNQWAAYSASKKAFDTWLGSVNPELEKKGVLISSLYLPLVRTRMIEPTKEYAKMPAMNPQHVADIVCNMIIKREKRYSPWWSIFAWLFSNLFKNIWASFDLK